MHFVYQFAFDKLSSAPLLVYYLHPLFMEVSVIYLLRTLIISLQVSCIISDKSIEFGSNKFDMSMFGDSNSTDLSVLHFENEQHFIDRFGDDPQIAKIFNTTHKRYHDVDIPGDMGMPVTVENPADEVRTRIEDGYKTYGYNKYVSDLISIHRRLPDPRNEWCFTPNRVPQMLLPTSVIMCYYNEALSVLLRTLQSIMSQSPRHLLAEIIILDDYSDHEEITLQLEEATRHISKVKLIRLPKREGLIRCRLFGSLIAHAPVLTFVDSHIEVAEGWLEPLLDQVTKNWKTIAVPVFNFIDPHTFACNFSDKPISVIGGFKWDLMFTFKEISAWDMRNVKTPADPIPTPTMPGGFFSIHRDFFNHLGKYDDQFETWGGENIELSFKTWMCGGSIVILPCSHVAHLERTKSVYSREIVWRNNARLAAVWLDEFAHFYFSRNGKQRTNITDGDVSSRLELKRNLNCSSFDWYLTHVIPSMFNPKSALASGELRNLGVANESFCLDSHEMGKVTESLKSLHWVCHRLGGNQFWYYTNLGELRQEQKCLDFFGGESVVLYQCHGMKGNQEWEYHGETGTIVHTVSQRCLSLEADKLQMSPCQGRLEQRWKFAVDNVYNNLNNFRFSHNNSLS